MLLIHRQHPIDFLYSKLLFSFLTRPSTNLGDLVVVATWVQISSTTKKEKDMILINFLSNINFYLDRTRIKWILLISVFYFLFILKLHFLPILKLINILDSSFWAHVAGSKLVKSGDFSIRTTIWRRREESESEFLKRWNLQNCDKS